MRYAQAPTLAACLFVLLLAVSSACSDQGQSSSGQDLAVHDAGADIAWPNLPGGNPLVPEVAAYPFPSDFYLVEDKTTLTGRRVSLPPEILPSLIGPEPFATMDGFSFTPPILAYLPGGVDPASLPADAESTLRTDSPVLLVREQTWDRVPVLAENDLTAQSNEERALIIRPLVALEPRTGYVVILRDTLCSPVGLAHRANPAFVALRDGVATEMPEIERQREDFKLVNAALSGLKIDPAQVVLAWSFHTRSGEQVTSTLLKMHDIADSAPLGEYTVVSDTIVDKDSTKRRQIQATFTAPDFIGSDGKIALDSHGDPVQQGTREVELGINIPSTIDEPRPVILYGHGFMGHWKQGYGGSIDHLCTSHRCSVLSSYIGFNEALQPLFTAAILSDMGRIEEVVAEVLQTLANVTVMARLVTERLSGELTTDWGNGPIKVLDPQRVQYLGISNGGTFGYVVAATSPRLTRATMLVGGGGMIHFLQRAVQWNEYGPALNQIYPNALDRQLMMSLMQLLLDPIDAMSYARRLVHDRFPGRQPLRASVHMAVNDSQVRNLVTEWVVRTASIPLITPSPLPIFGLPTISAPHPDGAPASTPAALFVYDEHVEPPPQGNLPPAEDNRTHSTVRDLEVYKQQVSVFIEDGTLVQVCDGACDPD